MVNILYKALDRKYKQNQQAVPSKLFFESEERRAQPNKNIHNPSSHSNYNSNGNSNILGLGLGNKYRVFKFSLLSRMII